LKENFSFFLFHCSKKDCTFLQDHAFLSNGFILFVHFLYFCVMPSIFLFFVLSCFGICLWNFCLYYFFRINFFWCRIWTFNLGFVLFKSLRIWPLRLWFLKYVIFLFLY
jgi:hypothetical protein